MTEPENVLNHPLVVRERERHLRQIDRLNAWLIVTATFALLELLILLAV